MVGLASLSPRLRQPQTAAIRDLAYWGSLLFRTTVSFPIEFFERGRSEVINQSRAQSRGMLGALPCVIGHCEVNTCSIQLYSHLFTSIHIKKKKFSDRRANFFRGGSARDRIADSTTVFLQ